MKRSVDLSIILPCYNEEQLFIDSLEKIVHSLRLSRFSFEIIFVDDKSTDKTPHLIALICKKYSYCKAIYHSTNEGRGKSVSDGITNAKGRVVGYLDIDCEVSPLYIPTCVDIILRKKADIVVGNRMYRSTLGSLFREITSVGYKRFSQLFVKTRNIDTESGYKFFNRTKIIPIMKQTKSTHWFWDTEIIVRSLMEHRTIVEMPVLFIRRLDKKSSVRFLPDMIDYVIQLIRLHRSLK